MERKTQQPSPQKEAPKEPQKKTRRRRLWEWTQFGEKGGWDWLQLLIIPLVLALGGLLFSLAQDARQQDAEERRAQAQRDAEGQRAQDEALQAYIAGMESLLLNEGLSDSQESDEVRTLARARTLTVLGRIDGVRKKSVVQFLYESELIRKDRSVVSLTDADLGGVDLRGASLNNVELSDADLSGADLSAAKLSGADLSTAKLSGADLSAAKLSDADLRGANLKGADLDRADLRGANLRRANLSASDLRAAKDLTQEQINEAYAYGDAHTKLPDHLQRPQDWSKGESKEN